MKRVLAIARAATRFAACDDEPKQLVGTISDATMNGITVCGPDGGEHLFPIEGADLSEANGLLAGSPVTVEYTGTPERVKRVLKVSTDATYAAAVGDWTRPDPIDENGVMGIRLQTGGAAESIRMATLVYTSWELLEEAGKIRLKGRSIGNGQTVDFEETAEISERDGRLTLTTDNGTFYTRER